MKELKDKIDNFSEQLNNVNVYKAKDEKELKARFSKKEVTMDTKIKPVAQFSADNLKLPLRITGELLRPGQYYTGKISEKELRKAFNNLVNDKKEILLFTTHDAFWSDSSNVNDVAGKLTNFDWDDSSKSIKFDGEIYDENVALKVMNKVVKGISAGFTYNKEGDEAKEIDINEGSLTFRPHCKTAQIQPVT